MRTSLLPLLLCIGFLSPKLFGQYTLAYQTNGAYVTLVGHNGDPDNLVVSNFVTAIGDLAFSYCDTLTNVAIPDSVTNIGLYAFGNCSSLATVTIGQGATNIGDGAFEYCTNLTQMIIPDSVTTIGNYTFQACEGLTNVVIGDNVTAIGRLAFADCGRLTEVTIPNKITDIANGVFEACESLTNVTIGDAVATIGIAFDSCRLNSVTIPASVTNIEELAFLNCGLASVYFLGNAPAGDCLAFLGAQTDFVLYYPAGASGWDSSPLASCGPSKPWNLLAGANVMTASGNNQFGFTISGPPSIPISVQAATDLTGNAWTNLQTGVLTNGSLFFSDPNSSNFTARFYRVLFSHP